MNECGFKNQDDKQTKKWNGGLKASIGSASDIWPRYRFSQSIDSDVSTSVKFNPMHGFSEVNLKYLSGLISC